MAIAPVTFVETTPIPISTLSPSFVDVVSTSQTLSPSERLFLAKLLLDSLLQEEGMPSITPTNGHTEPLQMDDDEWPTSEEIVRQILAMPAEPDAFHPATKSIEVWLAEQASQPPPPSSLSYLEWEQLWGEFESGLKAFEQTHAMTEGWNERHG